MKTNPNGEKVNLWLIDDDPISNVINKLYMFELNPKLNITSYDDPQNAIDILRNIMLSNNMAEIPHLILLDINMPRLSGWEFLDIFERELKSFFNETSIFMLSSSIDSDDLVKAKERTFIKGYFKKPLDDTFIKSI
jgi:CheY-like chemotaxis protein